MTRAIHYRSGGVWRNIVAPKAYASGAWRTPIVIYRNVAGSFNRVWPNTQLMTASSRASDTGLVAPFVSYFTTPLTDAITGNPWYVQYYYDYDFTDVTCYAPIGEGYWSVIDWSGRGTLFRNTSVVFIPFNGFYTQWRFNGDDLGLRTYGGMVGELVNFD